MKFGVFEVDLEACELRKSGMRLKLVGQPYEVLRLLLEHPQQVVTREALTRHLWPEDTHVEYDVALKRVINRLRDVLGDSAESPRFIETLPRLGYRFIAPVEAIGNGARLAASPEAPRVGSHPTTPARAAARRIIFAVGTVLALFALISAWSSGLFRGRSFHRVASASTGALGAQPAVNHSSLPASSVPVHPLVFRRTDYYVGVDPDSVVVGDFNNDGKLDLAVANPSSGTVCILLGNGDGTFQPAVHYAIEIGAFAQLASADFNGDHQLDLAVANNSTDHISVLLGNGDGTFRPPVIYKVGIHPTAIAVGDLNGDDELDLVVSNDNCNRNGGACLPGTVSILFGKGDGTFQPDKEIGAITRPNSVTLGDFNRDGKPDVAVVGGNAGNGDSPSLCILLGNGDGTFRAPLLFPLDTNPDSVAAADFNADGNLDLAVIDNIGLVSILLGKGDGTFQPRKDYIIGSFPWGHLAVADLNGDGKLDLAIANSGSNSITILLGKADGTFQPDRSHFETPHTPDGVAVGDFNGDGRLDLAVPARSSNMVSVMLQ